jgi:hypothetical protein
MSCVLRVWGRDFDVDSFLFNNTELDPINIWYKGQPKLKTKPNGHVSKTSGLSIELSDADFSELDKQINEAFLFCKAHQNILTKLVSYKGVEGAIADFGVEIYSPWWHSFSFVPKLLLLMGSIGISLGLSIYPISDEDE